MASNRPPLPNDEQKQHEDVKRHRSVFDLPQDFLDSCRLLTSPTAASSSSSSVSSSLPLSLQSLSVDKEVVEQPTHEDEEININSNNNNNNNNSNNGLQRWSCNTCKADFDSLQDQRSHFKSDLHRFNIKLTMAGKEHIKEEDLDETASDSLCKYYDISSISGSEDEDDKDVENDMRHGVCRTVKNKLFVQLQTGERISLWKCLLLDDRASILFDDDKFFNKNDGGNYMADSEVIEKLEHVIHETRDSTNLRVVLLARGGHFAGCVFDGNAVVAHKTFHRYVVRAKAGKKQSSKDASGKSIHSAGASIRRYNELALKKDIQELIAAWKPYFASASSIFIYAPSNNRQLFFDGVKPHFFCQNHAIRNIPLTVRRPTFKETKRIYNMLTQINYGVDDEITTTRKEDWSSHANVMSNNSFDSSKANLKVEIKCTVVTELVSGVKNSHHVGQSTESESSNTRIGISTPLHDAAKSGNAQKVLEFLEHDMDPSAKDERGRTPYMLATDKEVRNTFRRFMASHPDKWDWHTAKVPSPLTKEMEGSQAAKQAEKDAKRKAKAKELKKLRKAREKKAQAEAIQAQTASENRAVMALSSVQQHSKSSSSMKISKEEELKRVQDAEREKRAVAAEKRIAALAALRAEAAHSSNSPATKTTETSDISCSCCKDSLAGKIPFHRYNYKYCSSTCMHVHKEFLEDG